jgi:hypothetical protein
MLPPSFLKIKRRRRFLRREKRAARAMKSRFLIIAPLPLSGAGGREKTYGFFVQDFARIGSRVVLAASARFDKLAKLRGFEPTKTLATNQTTCR